METSLISTHKSSSQITEDCTQIKKHLTDIFILPPLSVTLLSAKMALSK